MKSFREVANKSSWHFGLQCNWHSRRLTQGMPEPVKVRCYKGLSAVKAPKAGLTGLPVVNAPSWAICRESHHASTPVNRRRTHIGLVHTLAHSHQKSVHYFIQFVRTISLKNLHIAFSVINITAQNFIFSLIPI